MTYKTFFLYLTSFSLACQQLWAAPFLRIHVPEATRNAPNALELSNGDQLPVWIPSGTNGPGNIFIEAWNSGDGNLNLQVSGGFSPWLQPRLIGSQPCSFDPGRSCQIIDVLFDSAGLPNGTFQGNISVSDPNATDSPQRVPVTIHVGGTVPERIDLYAAASPGSTDEFSFQTPTGPSPAVRVSPAGQYLSVSSSGLGSFRFVHRHLIRATVAAGMGAGDQQGSVEISGSSFAADNRNVPLTLHITSGPIASPSQSTVRVSAVAGGAASGVPVLGNRGAGALLVNSVDVETTSGGGWLSTEDAGGGVFRINAATGALAPGLYTGTARFNTNAANSPLAVPVEFEVQPAGPPEVLYKGVVNAAGFGKVPGIAAGTLVSLFGSQLAPSVEGATSIPLPRELASTSVKVNGIAAPLIFVSPGQINFQVPFEVPQGTGLVQVTREGQAGNTVSTTVLNRSPGIFRLGIGEYGVAVNASQSEPGKPPIFPIPPALAPPGLNAAPARPGDVLVIYATGLGPVTPQVGTGEAASADPLNRSADTPFVNFSQSPFGLVGTPFFAGMTPGFVGLFQINIVLPDNLATNPRTPITLQFGDGRRSNTVDVAVER